MRALDYLYAMKKANEDMGTEPMTIYEAIKEIVDLQGENKSLTKTLEKYNEEMTKLRIEKQELIQVLIDAQETINKILEK